MAAAFFFQEASHQSDEAKPFGSQTGMPRHFQTLTLLALKRTNHIHRQIAHVVRLGSEGNVTID